MLSGKSSLFDRLTESASVDMQTGAIRPLATAREEVKSMKVKMIKSAPGSIDGMNVQVFEAGFEYDVPVFMADSFIKKGYAQALTAKPTETKVVEPMETKEDLSEKTVDELKEMAKALDLSGYSGMKKSELIQAIEVAK